MKLHGCSIPFMELETRRRIERRFGRSDQGQLALQRYTAGIQERTPNSLMPGLILYFTDFFS